MVNKVILLGNLGRDPEIRSTQSGQTVATFSVATSRKWKDRDGNRQEQTEWHQIVAWGRQAEVAGQYLTRGSKVYVEGRLQTRSWEDRQTGEKKYRTEIVVVNFQMLGGGQGERRGSGGGYEGGGQGGYGGGYGGGSQGAGDVDDYGPDPEDEDIPF